MAALDQIVGSIENPACRRADARHREVVAGNEFAADQFGSPSKLRLTVLGRLVNIPLKTWFRSRMS